MVYVRYFQVKEYINAFRSPATSLSRWNCWALIFGIISAIGLTIVANFQESTVLAVHLIGALFCFGGGTVYFWTQVRTQSAFSNDNHNIMIMSLKNL